MLFKKHVVSLPTMSDYVKAKETLNNNGIRFWVRTKDMVTGGLFASRRTSGTLGMNMEYRLIYDIYVAKKDLENAKHLLHL